MGTETSDAALVLALPKRHRTINFEFHRYTTSHGSLIERALCRIRQRHDDMALFVETLASDGAELSSILAALGGRLIESVKPRSLTSLLEAQRRAGTPHVVLVNIEYSLAPGDLLERMLSQHHVSGGGGYTTVSGLPGRVSPEIYTAQFLTQLSQLPVRHVTRDPKQLAQLAFSASQISRGHATATPTVVTVDASQLYGPSEKALPAAVAFDTPQDASLAIELLAAQPDSPDVSVLQAWRATKDNASRRERAEWPRRHARAGSARRLLIVSNASLYSGAHAALINLITRLDHTRFRPYVLVSRSGIFSNQVAALGISIFCPEREFNAPTFENLVLGTRVFDEMRPDIVHCDGLEGTTICSVARLNGIPIVQSARVMDLGMLANELTFADHVVAVSHQVRRQVIRLGILPDLVSVVYDGVEPQLVSGHRRAAARKALGIGPDTLVVGALARIERLKRLGVIVSAVAEAQRKGHDVLALIAGERINEEYACEIASIAPDSLRLLGFQNDRDAVLDACDCIAAVGQAEAAGMAVMEGMAKGLPVIAAADGGGSELVEHGVTGYVVDVERRNPLHDVVTALAVDPDLKVRMGTSGFQRCCDRFSAVGMASAMMDLYQHYCEAPAQQSRPSRRFAPASQLRETHVRRRSGVRVSLERT
jgi:glycosyltransferase involved in cell wall biosynthesis